MSRHLSLTRALMLAAALGAGACSNNDTTATTPTTPSLGTLAEAFTGSLTVNGAQSFPFAVTTGGSVTAQLLSVAPDATLVVGLSLGTWSSSGCSVVLANDLATQGTTILGTASGAGNLCVRVYDVGRVTAATPVGYTVQVTHP